ncbi:MAG: S-adenosylmethionine hydrolase [Planctomycetota bacterium]
MQKKNARMLLPLFLSLLAAGCTTIPKPDLTRPLPAHVVRISEEYANINTDIHKKTLKAYGIEQQAQFSVTFKEQKFRALLGEGYGDVERGDWIALIEEDDTLQLAISFGNAATEIGCSIGDTLYIERIGPGE